MADSVRFVLLRGIYDKTVAVNPAHVTLIERRDGDAVASVYCTNGLSVVVECEAEEELGDIVRELRGPA